MKSRNRRWFWRIHGPFTNKKAGFWGEAGFQAKRLRSLLDQCSFDGNGTCCSGEQDAYRCRTWDAKTVAREFYILTCNQGLIGSQAVKLGGIPTQSIGLSDLTL